MRSRWLIGLSLFALGFGTACLWRLPRAEGSDNWKWYEPDLGVQESGDKLLIKNVSPAASYLAMTVPKPGSPNLEPVRFSAGLATITRTGIQSVTVYRLEPVTSWEDPGFRPCNGPVDCSLAPPLPPIPPRPQTHYVGPGGTGM